MKDGPEDSEGVYEYGEQTYRLEEAASGIWSVYLDDTYLGVLRVPAPEEDESGPHYTARVAGEEHDNDGEVMDDWQAALDLLIEISTE